MKVRKGKSQPDIVAAFVVLYIGLGTSFSYQVLIQPPLWFFTFMFLPGFACDAST